MSFSSAMFLCLRFESDWFVKTESSLTLTQTTKIFGLIQIIHFTSLFIFMSKISWSILMYRCLWHGVPPPLFFLPTSCLHTIFFFNTVFFFFLLFNVFVSILTQSNGNHSLHLLTLYTLIRGSVHKLSCYHKIVWILSPGPPREILQGGTRLLWGPRDRLRFISKLRIWGPIKPLVHFHECLISCAAEFERQY